MTETFDCHRLPIDLLNRCTGQLAGSVVLTRFSFERMLWMRQETPDLRVVYFETCFRVTLEWRGREKAGPTMAYMDRLRLFVYRKLSWML